MSFEQINITTIIISKNLSHVHELLSNPPSLVWLVGAVVCWLASCIMFSAFRSGRCFILYCFHRYCVLPSGVIKNNNSCTTDQKKTDDGYQGKWCLGLRWILSELTAHVKDRCFFTVCWIKIEQNPCVLVKCSKTLGGSRFIQIRRKIIKLIDIPTKIWKLLTYYMSFYH